MEKSEIHQQLEGAIKTKRLSPDNHDEVNAAIGLLSAESADKVADAMRGLSSSVHGMGKLLSATITGETTKTIASNEKVAASNERYAKASQFLAIALIIVTLMVGLIQAGVLIWQTALTKASLQTTTAVPAQ